MKIRHLTASLAFVALAGCAAPAAYAPADGPHGAGYSDARLAQNRYRVTFTGNSVTKRETVENFLLLRAAEVTRDAGYSWFVFDDRDTEAKTSYHTAFTGFGGYGPGFGHYWHSWQYDPWDPYWDQDSITIPRTRYEAYAEIVLLTPDQAHSDAHALQASDVIGRLGPSATPPPTH